MRAREDSDQVPGKRPDACWVEMQRVEPTAPLSAMCPYKPDAVPTIITVTAPTACSRPSISRRQGHQPTPAPPPAKRVLPVSRHDRSKRAGGTRSVSGDGQLRHPQNSRDTALNDAPAEASRLSAIARLGYILRSIEKGLGAFCTVDSAIQHVVPCDVWIEIVSFRLLLKEGL